MNTTTREKTVKELFIGQCWEYLRDNFYKFNETNKIKIALELCKKDVPQQVEGFAPETKVIIIRDGNKAETVAGQIHIQQEQVSGPVDRLGLRQDDVPDISGHVLQRADSE